MFGIQENIVMDGHMKTLDFAMEQKNVKDEEVPFKAEEYDLLDLIV